MEVYTLDQVQAFARAVEEEKLLNFRVLAVSMRSAFGAKARDWKKFVKALEPKEPLRPGETPADRFVRQLEKSGLWGSLTK